jgi:ABC-2 type transport system permease protein
MARAARERGDLCARVSFFAVILGVFSSLWRAVAEAGMPLAADPRSLVWYLAATEWVLLSAPPIFIELEESIRRGDVVYHTGRPVSYLLAEFAQGIGLVATRAPVLGLTAFCCAFGFTGWMPPARALAMVVPFGLAAMMLLTALYLCLGLLAFWLQDVSPVFWVWQKLMFVLGGLMLPLSLYPDFVQRLAMLTPFPTMLGGPASFVLGAQAIDPGVLGTQLVLWLSVAALTARAIFRRALKELTVNGG